ncbi:MAG: DUF1109 domain-containing protein [Pseudomonadota bacterium]|nr:DUF1109 domain-containing protein [Pseudomonadota bacterium]
MRTEQFIALLARGPIAADRHLSERRIGVAAAAGALAAAVLLGVMLGPRPDLASAVLLPAFWLKLAFPVSLAMAAYAATCRLARPNPAMGMTSFALVAPLLAAALLAGAAAVGASSATLAALVQGHSAIACMSAIALFALPTFVVTLLALRTLAPTRLRAAGACAGLLAGACAASVYAFHCDEMGALFVAVWYVLGMAVPTALGALLGPRLLRWV